MTLSTSNIEDLIAARARLTGRSDEQIDRAATQAIDSVLSEVPVGQRPDVDLLLGRRAPDRPMYQRNAQRQAPADWTHSQTTTLDELSASRAAVTQHAKALAGVDMSTITLHSFDIAEMEARCNETNRADDYASHTEGHW